MRRSMPLLPLLLALVSAAMGAAPRPIAAQPDSVRFIRGIVADSGGNVIPYATVAAGKQRFALTDRTGRFSLAMAPGESVTLEVRRMGFLPARLAISAGTDTSVSIRLAGRDAADVCRRGHRAE